MAVFNLRLSPEQERRVKWLRKKGLIVSEVCRKAIDTVYEEQQQHKNTKRDLPSILLELDEKFPLPTDHKGLGIDTTNRHAVREYINKQLRRKRPA
jgi:hypothetical protein